MSHAATNWAITRRGLKPAARIVLWHLADCHNPKLGCFPSQEWLADACEMSRSTINLHLEKLEEAGLIRRSAGRCPETGKQLPTRYVLGFEIAETARNYADPCPETGHGRDAEPVSENGQNPSPKNGDIRVRNSDSNPVREPVIEPVSERERASADEAANGKKGDDDGEPVTASKPETSAEMEKRVMRFCTGEGEGYQGGEWPKWTGSSLSYIKRRFAELSSDDQLEAERWRDAFLAKAKQQGVKVPMPVGNYFRDRAWQTLSETEMARALAAKDRGAVAQSSGGVADVSRPEGWANSMGPVWAVLLHEILLEGPENPEHAPGNGLWLRFNLQRAWPKVAKLYDMAQAKRGFVASERHHDLKGQMEFVPQDSGQWAAWEAEFKARGWPAWPRRDGMDGMYFPAGGPDGLAAFRQALAGRNTTNHTGNEAAE